MGLLAATVLMMHFGVRDIAFPPLFALVILSLALNERLVARMLSHPVLLWLGAISYSVYLSHMLVLSLINVTSVTVFGKTMGRFLDTWPSLIGLVGLIALVLALSAWLYRNVEVRGRNLLRQGRFARRYIYR